jgi:carboxypeptidase family protein
MNGRYWVRRWWRVPGFRAATLVLALAIEAGAQNGVPTARVTGVVYDSMAMRPLFGALVQLALVPSAGSIDTVRSVLTDSLGRYDFASVPLGTYLLGFQHVAMDSLGLSGPLQRLDVRTPSTVRAPMAVPSMVSIIRTVCGGRGTLKDSLAALLGSIRHAKSDTPLPGAFVSLRWGEVILGRGGTMERSTPIVDTFTNDEGWFTACVPGGVQMTVRATHNNDLSGNVELGVPAHAVLRRDIYVGPALAELRRGDSTATGRAREERIVELGRGELRGVVRALDGAPIDGARVALLSGEGETRTNARGEFVLAGLPFGSHTIEARAIGYVPGQSIADIVEFRNAVAEFVLLDVSAYLLDTVRVAAARRLDAAAREGFERRRKSGAGQFIDESVLDTMKAFTFKDLVRRFAFIRFVRGNTLETSWREHIEFLGRTGEFCLPVIYLDGSQLVSENTDLDVIIHPASVRRIEAYQSGLALPAEFASNKNCGVLAIWTGARLKR